MILRENFIINCPYVDDDGTTDDIYRLYKILYENQSLIDFNFDFSVSNLNYSLDCLSELINLYIQSVSYSDGSVTIYPVNDSKVSKSEIDGLDIRYQRYFYYKDLLNSDDLLIFTSKSILDILNIRQSAYYVLFIYILLGGKVN